MQTLYSRLLKLPELVCKTTVLIILGLLVISFGGILTIICAVLMAKDGVSGAIDWLKRFLV